MKPTPSINNEKGTALIIALMLLVLLTLLGMAATTTSTLEIMIAGNERDYKVNFYEAESAAIQAAVTMENEPNPNVQMRGWGPRWGANGENWLRHFQDATKPDMTDLDVWDDITGDPDATQNDYSDWADDQDNVISDGNEKIAYYAAKFIGVGLGDSLDVAPDGSRKYSYVIYGYSKSGNGRALIEVGYKRAF